MTTGLLFRVIADDGREVVAPHLVEAPDGSRSEAERSGEIAGAWVEAYGIPAELQFRDPDGLIAPADRWVTVARVVP